MCRLTCTPSLRATTWPLLLAVMVAFLITLAPSEQQGPNRLEKIQQRGRLTVLTCNGPTTYYHGPGGQAGLEYELAGLFAARLGVELEIVTRPSRRATIQALTEGGGDLAAAGIIVTDRLREIVRFAPSYQSVAEQIVYRRGEVGHPETLADLNGQPIVVSAESCHAEHLARLAEQHPGLVYQESPDANSDELLFLTYEGKIPYTVADSHKIALYRRYFPELRVGPVLTEVNELAWALPQEEDDSLYRAVAEFIDQAHTDGTLSHLLERYYGHLDRIDYVGTRRFMRHAQERLPQYEAWFKEAATAFGFDWRLLAAVSYQESHWDPAAVSPTGVRGLMMLTLDTATEVGVTDREDPRQSIMGGAKYLAGIRQRIAADIGKPDRDWLALVSYNIGHGHLLDAFKLTERLGQDPTRWVDIKDNLPKLERQQWYRELTYGYAPGYSAIHYVQNIRAYYDLLVWHTDGLEMLPLPETLIDPTSPPAGLNDEAAPTKESAVDRESSPSFHPRHEGKTDPAL